MKRKVAVVGASGYAGAELLRLLVPHPGVELVAVTSETYTAKPVVAAFPSLTGFVDLSFAPHQGSSGQGAKEVRTEGCPGAIPVLQTVEGA